MNTNPKAIRILCYGDSNTWGYIPDSHHERLDANVRWPGQLQQLLGSSYEIIEEGLNSRTISQNDSRPGKEGRNGKEYVIPCIDTHDPIDLIILMLGTNELKAEYNLSPEEIGESLDDLLKIIISRKSQFRKISSKLLLVSPPLVDETAPYCKKGDKYLGATQKSKEIKNIYSKLAEAHNCLFLSASDFVKPGSDGIHLPAQEHTNLAKAIADKISKIKFY